MTIKTVIICDVIGAIEFGSIGLVLSFVLYALIEFIIYKKGKGEVYTLFNQHRKSYYIISAIIGVLITIIFALIGAMTF